MPPPPNNQNVVSKEEALFVVTPIYEKDKKQITLKFEKGPSQIKELMSDEAKVACGMDKLLDQHWANLSAWLDPDKVVAPGDPPK